MSILGALGFHFEGPGGLKTGVEVQEPPGRGPRATGKGSGRRRVRPGPAWEAFLVPTPKSNKKVLEDDAKRRQFLEGLRDPTWSGFGRVLGAKMDPCWHPKSIPKWMLS